MNPLILLVDFIVNILIYLVTFYCEVVKTFSFCPHQTLEQQFAQMKSLNSTPPPPTSKRPGEVQYLDLDLNSETSEAEKSPIFPKSLAVRCVTPTDYKEIDFIKTKALNDMKKDLEKKRKSSEKSVDE